MEIPTPLTALQAELETVGAVAFTARGYRPGIVTHIVLFRYAESTSAEQRAEVSRRFHALADTERDGARYIVSIDSGEQVSGEVEPSGYDEAFVVRFASLGDRNFYVGEPIVSDPAFFDEPHARFKEFAAPQLAEAGVLVFDFQQPAARER